jgi:hypothetical protein
MFVFYMSTHRKKDGSPLFQATIDGYVFMWYFTIDYGIIDSTTDFRSFHFLITALTLQDAQRLGPPSSYQYCCVFTPYYSSLSYSSPPSCFLVLTQQFITAAMYLFCLKPPSWRLSSPWLFLLIVFVPISFFGSSGYINILGCSLTPSSGNSVPSACLSPPWFWTKLSLVF